jgi:hypothetical protein
LICNAAKNFRCNFPVEATEFYFCIVGYICSFVYEGKRLEKEAAKARKASDAEKIKVKNAIQKANHDGARIYAENAIRQNQMELQFMRLGSKLDGVASRLKMQEFYILLISCVVTLLFYKINEWCVIKH